MKKRIALLLVIVMLFAFAAVGCNNATEDTTDDTAATDTTDTADDTTDDTAEDTADDTSEVASDEPPAEKTVKAGFIYIGPADDGGFSSSHDAGRLYLEEQLGVETVVKELVEEGAGVESVIDNMVDLGCNVIFGCSYGYMDYMEAKADEYPDVVFLHCSGYKSNGTNFANYFGRIYEARFLSGIAAGLATETNQIGYVAAFGIPEVIRGMNAFALGVQAVNPDASVEVLWTHDWVDATVAKEAANTLISGGCDVIAQHQDATSPQQAAEEAGVFSVGYHCDMSGVAPSANIGSAVWNWGPYYVSVVQAIQDGTWDGSNYWGGMGDDTVRIVLTDNAPEGAQEKVDEYTAMILDEGWSVFTGPLTDNEGNVIAEDGATLTDDELLSMMWLNENIIGSVES